MEEPAVRALATERLTEREATIQTLSRPPDNSAKIAKDELSSLTDSFRGWTATADDSRADDLAG